MRKPRAIRCHKCKYEWWTKTEHEYVTCPDCHYKVNVKKNLM